MGKGKKAVVLISAIIIIVYIIWAIYLLIVHPVDVYIINQGTISQEDEAVGYIIRDEQVQKNENNTNGIYAMVSEGQRVAINEPIFRYYSNSEKEITSQINELNYKIQDLLEQDNNNSSTNNNNRSADIKSIENQIEAKIENINSLTNFFISLFSVISPINFIFLLINVSIFFLYSFIS